MLAQISRTLETHRLLDPGDPVLVAVSGGADSVALLHALHFLKDRLALRLAVAHVHHGIRPGAADRDADFVRARAWQLGIPFHLVTADVPRTAARRRVSLEMAGREVRLEAFARLAADLGGAKLALGHHADDQAETVLLRLVRGSGTSGLGGMRHRVEYRGLVVVRPLLDVTREEILGFLRRHRIAWREDATNLDLSIPRNRVRHRVWPELAQLNPRAREALLRTAENLKVDDEALEEWAERLLPECLTASDPPRLRLEALDRHPRAVRRRLVRQWMVAQGIDVSRVTSDTMRRAEELLAGSRGSSDVPLPGGATLRRQYGEAFLLLSPVSPVPADPARLRNPGCTSFPELGIRVRVGPGQEVCREAGRRLGRLPARVSLSGQAVGGAPLYIRTWREGDRIRPLGLKGSTKLHDLFVNAKVPQAQRSRVPVLVCRDSVVWLPGYRVAVGWEVREGEDCIVEVAVEAANAGKR